MDALKIIKKYYDSRSLAYHVLTTHSNLVMKKAVKIASNLQKTVDVEFVKQASLLHDIGIIFTNAPGIGCQGDKPYLFHGCLGREILEKEGFPKHALVCERHTGVGITKKEIVKNSLGLPERDMVPQSLEEKIICYADKFYSKNLGSLKKEKNVAEITAQLSKFNKKNCEIFLAWHEQFEPT